MSRSAPIPLSTAGPSGDTVIGEGSKIDNMVHIAHNVSIGRHCLLAGQVGISGSTTVEDGVIMGGQAGVADHLTVGAGAMLGGQGRGHERRAAWCALGRVSGESAKRWLREVLMLERLAQERAERGRARGRRVRMRDMTDAGTTLEAADIATILKSLPHRYPFLMVDRIINIRGDESGVGIKNVTINEPQFMGHFPGQSGISRRAR